jgi:hypothetical protein
MAVSCIADARTHITGTRLNFDFKFSSVAPEFSLHNIFVRREKNGLQFLQDRLAIMSGPTGVISINRHVSYLVKKFVRFQNTYTLILVQYAFGDYCLVSVTRTPTTVFTLVSLPITRPITPTSFVVPLLAFDPQRRSVLNYPLLAFYNVVPFPSI